MLKGACCFMLCCAAFINRSGGLMHNFKCPAEMVVSTACKCCFVVYRQVTLPLQILPIRSRLLQALHQRKAKLLSVPHQQSFKVLQALPQPNCKLLHSQLLTPCPLYSPRPFQNNQTRTLRPAQQNLRAMGQPQVLPVALPQIMQSRLCCRG